MATMVSGEVTAIVYETPHIGTLKAVRDHVFR